MKKERHSLQQLLQQNFTQYAATNAVALHHFHAARQLQSCRTAAMGGHIQACPAGHIERVWYNSCKHRSCPQCKHIQIERWLAKQTARLLDYPHHHIIFTQPHELNTLWQYNRTQLTQVLFKTVRDTLIELTSDPRYLGALPAILLALHTWGRSLSLHPHIHCLITDGGLNEQRHWCTPKKSVFLPIRVVMTLFRGKYLAAIRQLLNQHCLKLPTETSPQQLHNLLNKLGRKKWHVHIQERYEHGEGVVKYLARYVRGGPLSNSQLQSVNTHHVRFGYYSHALHKYTNMTLTTTAFLKRILEHVPDKGKQWLRHYGLYAHRKVDSLNHARECHGQPPVKKITTIEWQDYVDTLGHNDSRCSVCGEPIQATRYFSRWHAPPINNSLETQQG